MNHLPFSKKELAGATLACITGDPFRVPVMAKELDPSANEISHSREFAVYRATLQNQPVIVASHGIGGPSLAILVEELAMAGIQDFLRVGTSGAIQTFIEKGDVVISAGSVRLEGVTPFYAPLAYPAISHPNWILTLQNAADQLNICYHTGITASTDSFYPGQQRTDTKTQYIIPPWDQAITMWRQLQVLNYEMESSTLFVLGSVMSLKVGCITSVIVERDQGETFESSSQEGVSPAWLVAKKALGFWLNDSENK